MKVNINNNKIKVLKSVFIGDIGKYNTISDGFEINNTFYVKRKDYKGFSTFTNDDIDKTLETHKTEDLRSKTVFVDKLCKIPTFDLTQNKIVRKRCFNDADICVAPKASFNTLYDAVILFNGTDYIISYITELYYASWIQPLDRLLKNIHFNKPIDLIESLLEDNAPYLEGYNVIYEGVITLADKSNIDFLMNYDKYHHTVSEQEYLKYLSKNKEDITLDVINQIEDVLKSGNRDNISMYLLMMTTYNTDAHVYEIMQLLCKYYYVIDTFSAVKNKIAFVTFLSKYGLTFKDIYFHKECNIINNIWHLMSEKQKDDFINKKISCVKSSIKGSFEMTFQDFRPFDNYEFKIEVTSDEANFSFTRES